MKLKPWTQIVNSLLGKIAIEANNPNQNRESDLSSYDAKNPQQQVGGTG